MDNEFIQCLFGGENNYNNDGRGGEKEENEKMSRRFKGGSLVYSRRPADPVPISPQPATKKFIYKNNKVERKKMNGKSEFFGRNCIGRHRPPGVARYAAITRRRKRADPSGMRRTLMNCLNPWVVDDPGPANRRAGLFDIPLIN